jgi:Protein phosphatase 2C
VRIWMATEPARPGAANEDFAAVSLVAAVLLDGAGIPEGLDSGCCHGVAWYSRGLGSVLLSELTAAEDQPIVDALAKSIGQVAAMHAGTCDLSHPASPSSTVVAARFAGGMLDYLVLSDSALMIHQPGTDLRVITDDRLDQVARPHRGPIDGLPTGSDEHPGAFRDYMVTVRAYRNTEAGFWVASADPATAAHALTGQVRLTGAETIMLLSDGATRLAEKFGLATWPELAEIVAEHGPGELIRRTRAAEASDPAGRRWPRSKACDDATAMCLMDICGSPGSAARNAETRWRHGDSLP